MMRGQILHLSFERREENEASPGGCAQLRAASNRECYHSSWNCRQSARKQKKYTTMQHQSALIRYVCMLCPRAESQNVASTFSNRKLMPHGVAVRSKRARRAEPRVAKDDGAHSGRIWTYVHTCVRMYIRMYVRPVIFVLSYRLGGSRGRMPNVARQMRSMAAWSAFSSLFCPFALCGFGCSFFFPSWCPPSMWPALNVCPAGLSEIVRSAAQRLAMMNGHNGYIQKCWAVEEPWVSCGAVECLSTRPTSLSM